MRISNKLLLIPIVTVLLLVAFEVVSYVGMVGSDQLWTTYMPADSAGIKAALE